MQSLHQQFSCMGASSPTEKIAKITASEHQKKTDPLQSRLPRDFLFRLLLYWKDLGIVSSPTCG